MKQALLEYNFDGLVGPTHNYAGLGRGNLASLKNKHLKAQPKKAALEGLNKMKFLMDRGFRQGIFPPHSRPHLPFLKSLGLKGSPSDLLEKAHKLSPELLSACYSASSMWTANSAVISSSIDTLDKLVHITPANLHSCLHRSLESAFTAKILKAVFKNPKYFKHHPPLPSVPAFADEGSANTLRFSEDDKKSGLVVFVYGKNNSFLNSSSFFPRQSLLAVQTLALRHKIKNVLFTAQNPQAIARGVFHNDVISLSQKNLFICHELAFINNKKVFNTLQKKIKTLKLIEVKDISLKQAVDSYLFNSQILPLEKGQWLWLAPEECRMVKNVKQFLFSLKEAGFIKEVFFTSLRQSMKNGGGPACLRLNVLLTPEESKALHQGIILTPALYKKLKTWIEKHYREDLAPQDLLDPKLMEESFRALDELEQILKLKKFYDF